MRRQLLHIFMVLLFSGCVNQRHGNNGVGYGGGDLLFGNLSQSAAQLADRLNTIEQTRPKLCRANGLSIDQSVFCETFLHTNAAALKAIAQRSPADLFEITTDPLIVDNVTVLALTELGPSGKIRVNRALAEKLSPEAILALVGHELGHKIAHEQTFLTDAQTVGPFTGRALLDAVGSALAAFTGKLESLAAAYDTGEVSAASSSAGATFTNTVPVVISVSATVTAAHISSAPEAAGVNAVLTVDGTHCGHDQAMQSAALGITFITNVSCFRLLQPGTHQLVARDATAGDYPNMGPYSVTLKYRAIVAPGASAQSPIVKFEDVAVAGTSVSRTFTTTEISTLEVAGRTNANYAPTVSSYVEMSAKIEVNGQLCGESLTSGRFGAAGLLSGATCIRQLPAGTHTVTVRDARAGSYAGLSGQGAAMQLIVSRASAKEVTPDGSGGDVFTNTVPVVLSLSAYFTARHSGSVNGAGVFPVIYIDGNYCGADASFEFEAADMGFHASASCLVKLAPGSHVITVRNRGGDYAGMSQFASTLQYSALAQP